MKKKVLLAAVGNYRELATRLVAPVEELDRWQQLLTSKPYDMQLIRKPLKDGDATRANIIAGLEELFKDAGKDDQLMFVFCGHGSRIDVPDGKGIPQPEQVLLACPGSDNSLKNAAIKFSDLVALLVKSKAHEQADVTFVIDACFSRGAVGWEGVVPLYAPLEDEEHSRKITVFGASDRVRAFLDLPLAMELQNSDLVPASILAVDADPRPTCPQLVVLAASRKDEAAYQFQESAKRHRLVFSSRAITRLKKNRDTPDELVANINPLRDGFPQHAAVLGSEHRVAEVMAGAKDSKSLAARSAISSVEENMSSIRIRSLGLGCFIEPRVDSPFLNRIVLPRDTQGTGSMEHIAFVEVAEDDIHAVTGNLSSVTYIRGGVSYRRWQLTGHRVWLHNGVTDGTFTRSAGFQKHVPLMTDVCPELNSEPQDACYETDPDSTWFSGFIDLQDGDADKGPLELYRTVFTRELGEAVTRPAEFAARWLFVNQSFTGDYAILMIANFDNSSNAQIFIHPGSTIAIGNAREIDITGNPLPENTRANFVILYNLADPQPTNRALPAMDLSPINACSDVRWP